MIANFGKNGNREFFNKQLLSKTIGVFFLIVVGFLILVDVKIYQKKRELMLQVNVYKEQIDEIKKSSQTLKEQIANADNVDYLEKLGYEQFDRTRPGETEYMFIKSSQNPEVVSGQGDFWSAKSWVTWFTGAWDWIKSKF